MNWVNIKSINQIYSYDLVVANGDCRLFKYAKSKKTFYFHIVYKVLKNF